MGKPRVIWDSKGKSREEWLEVRAHGPTGALDYTLGGSDIPIIFGLSPWTTPLELWHMKKGLLVSDDSSNEDAKEMGHLMEPIVGHFYEKKSGNEEIEDTLMYQHETRDYAIADIDARFRDKDTGEIGIVEKKFITFHKRFEWEDGMVPPMYEMQGRWYMGVVDLPMTDYAAMWGNNAENDLAMPRISRDAGTEAMIFDRADDFIKSLRSGTAPKMDDVHNAKLALQALARVYGKSMSGLPTIEFSAKFEKHIRKIEALQSENEKLRQSMKKNDEEIDGHSVKIAEAMKKHECGEYNTPSEKFTIFFSSRFTSRPDSKALKNKYPTIFEEVLKTTESRKVKVKKEVF